MLTVKNERYSISITVPEKKLIFSNAMATYNTLVQLCGKSDRPKPMTHMNDIISEGMQLSESIKE